MIVQQTNDPMLVIRQTDHAILAGFFAREWGNELFPRPEPFASFCLAAAEHDNGWQEWELAPGVDPKTFVPYSFMSVPTGEHVLLYQRGIDRVVKSDLYAGLLVIILGVVAALLIHPEADLRRFRRRGIAPAAPGGTMPHAHTQSQMSAR